MSLALASRRAAISPAWVKNPLWRTARAVPSLDQPFADTKSLTDAVTGQSLVTFTRASSATYVGSDGLVKTATTNLLLRSEEFDITWSGVATTVSSNTTIAPNGTLTADTLTDTNAAGDAYLRQSIANPPNSATYTGSIYLKQGTTTTTRVSLTFFGATTVNRDATVTWSSNTTNYGTLTSVGNGWYRLAFSETNNASGNTSLLFTIRASGDVTGSETGTVFTWGAQLEASSTVGEYIPTTSTINSAPRFDHNPTTGESLGLLVEEQRTNLVVQSEDFGTTWTTTGLLAFGSGSTLNATTAPTGALTADLITEDTSSGNHRIATAAISWAGNTQYTFSCFVKANGRSSISFLLGTAGNWVNSSREAQFNLSTGTVSYTSGTPVTASITAFPSGWYRLTMTATTVAAPSASSVFIQMMDSTPVASYTGNGTSGVFLFGAQLEAGAFPTSYIPTTTAAATRSADVASITGTAFSSWYRQDEGTFYADVFRQFAVPATDFPVVATCRSATDINQLGYLTEAVAGTYVVVSGVSQSELYPIGLTNVRNRRLAHSYAANNFAATVNGNIPLTDTSGSIPTVSTMSIGSVSGNSQFLNGTIRRLVYWGQRLPNNVLQAITQ